MRCMTSPGYRTAPHPMDPATLTLPLRELYLLLQIATQHMSVRAQHKVLYSMGIVLQDHMDLTNAALEAAGFPLYSGDDDYYSDESE